MSGRPTLSVRGDWLTVQYSSGVTSTIRIDAIDAVRSVPSIPGGESVLVLRCGEQIPSSSLRSEILAAIGVRDGGS